MKPAVAAERIATVCADATHEAAGRRWKAAEDLLREATTLAAGMTSIRVGITKVTPLKGTGDPGHSQSLERGLAILALFTAKRPIWGIAEMADATKSSRSTTHRYASTLVTLSQLEQVAGRRYKRVTG